MTLVLYFGHEKPWSGPLSLKERLNVPKEFEPYVNDYKINLFQIAYLTREQVELFQSDFKVVADYFVQKRENGDYVPSSQDLTHVQETLQLLSIMTNDHRFEDAYTIPVLMTGKEAHAICVMCLIKWKTEALKKAS